MRSIFLAREEISTVTRNQTIENFIQKTYRRFISTFSCWHPLNTHGQTTWTWYAGNATEGHQKGGIG